MKPELDYGSDTDSEPVEALRQESASQDIPEGKEAEPDSTIEAVRTKGRTETDERYRAVVRELRAAREEPVLVPGDVLGDFEVVDVHASGATSDVYRARQRSLGGRIVALKVPRRPAQVRVRERFERESLILAELHHTNLAEVYGFGRQDGFSYLAMRLVCGRTLARHLRDRGAIEPRQAVGWTTQISRALALAHEQGLVHRDVKPSNVVLEEGDAEDSPRAVLVDFGLVRPVRGWTRTVEGLAPLTAAYAAPEQLGREPVDQRVDVFALGALLHDLLSGTCPDQRELALHGALSDPPCGPGIDADLRAVVTRAVNLDPSKRYPDAGELLLDLEAWLDGRPVEARRGALRERLVRWTWRNRWAVQRWSALAFVSLAVLVAAGYSVSVASNLSAIRAAAARSDFARVREAGSALPAGLSRWLPASAGAFEVARRLSSDSEEESLVAIAEHQAAGEHKAALAVAAKRLAGVGFDGDLPVLGLLLEFARRETPSRLRTRAISYLAMVAAEGPRMDGGPSISIDVVRELARGTWADEQAPLVDRLYALSALSTVGSLEDARRVASAFLRRAWSDEETRLQAQCLERLLRRSWSAGNQMEMLEQVPWDALLSRLRALRESNEFTWGAAVGMSRMAVAVHLARRREGLSTDASQALPPSWLDTPPRDEKVAGVEQLAIELAAGRDARALSFLEASTTELRVAYQAQLATHAAVLLGSKELLVRVRRIFLESGLPARTIGSVLGASIREAMGELKWARTSADMPRDGGLLGKALPDADGFQIGARPFPQRTGVRAEWVLKKELGRAFLGGTATGFQSWGVEHRAEGLDPPSALLGNLGSSRLQLEFDWPRGISREDFVLRVAGQNSARPYLPYQGVVRLVVYLDGRDLGSKSITRVEQGDEVFEFPRGWLEPGRHVLEVRLGVDSTTSYRLTNVQIRDIPD